MKVEQSHTGKALREAVGGWRFAVSGESHDAASVCAPTAIRQPLAAPSCISIHGAREHNLQNIDVQVPRNRFTVVTGVSGSGKSTLAFDIVFGEGQRRYLESLNAYARQFVQPASRPDVDAIFGIPPTVAIEQRTSRGGRKSTVATLTEIYHFLRLLYVKLGTQYCPDCDVPIEPQSFESIAARVLKDYRGKKISLLAPLVVARKGYYTDLAAWAGKKGYAQLRVDGKLLPTDNWPRLSRFHEHTIELPVGSIAVSPRAERELRAALTTALDFGKGVVHVIVDAPSRAAARAGATTTAIFSTRRACPSCARSFAELDPRLFSFNSKHGWCAECFGTGLQLRGFDEEQTGEEWWWSEGADAGKVCSGCAGERLNEIARSVRFRRESIAALTAQSVAGMRAMFAKLKLQGRESAIARDVLAEINSRLAFLEEVGLGYLALDRSAPTLSGGEAQRIQARGATGLEPAGRVLHPRRADDRPASARQPHPARHARAPGGEGEFAAGRRARRGHDPARRPRHRSRPGGRHARRLRRSCRNGQRAATFAAVDHRAPAGLAAASSARATTRGEWSFAGAHDRSRIHAQPAATELPRAARAAGCRHRRLGIRQVDAGARRPARQLARRARPASWRQSPLAGLPCAARLGAGWPRAGSRSDADRQNAALLSRHVRRLLGCDPACVRRDHRGADARLHGFALFLQHRGRTLRGMRGAGHASYRDELSAGCARDLRHLRRPALQSRHADRRVPRQERRRRPHDERRRRSRLLRCASTHSSRVAAAAGRWAGLPHAGAAEPDALGRRSTAHQAGDRAFEGELRRRALERRARPARSTSSTSRPSVCTWRTSRS